MASLQAATAGLNVRQGTARAGQRVDGVLVAVIIALLVATLFAALSAAYFGVAAGTDLPEPWTQMSD